MAESRTPTLGTKVITADREAVLADPTLERITVGGTAAQTFRFLVALLAAALVGWGSVDATLDGSLRFPGWIWGALVAALVIALVTFFRPHLARVTGWVYAVLEGLAVGAISRAYDTLFDGIVMQAVLATIGVTVVMLWLYTTRRLKVTRKFYSVVMTATLGILIAYMAGLLMYAFGVDLIFWNRPTPLGILITAGIAVIAALNLVIDFAFIEDATKQGLPARWQYYFAFSLLVTLVWLYLELLRLLALLSGDD